MSDLQRVRSDLWSSTLLTPSVTLCMALQPKRMIFKVVDQCIEFHSDGRVVYEGTPDEAAVAFWKAVEALWPADWKLRSA